MSFYDLSEVEVVPRIQRVEKLMHRNSFGIPLRTRNVDAMPTCSNKKELM